MEKRQGSEKIRSFIAIELPARVRAGLRQVQESLKNPNPGCAKWVDPESIHLTLKFLGDVESKQLSAVEEALEKAAADQPVFNLEIKGMGAFPDLRRIQIVWAGIEGDLSELQAFQKNIEAIISPLGFPPENRAFKPHLTLARVRDTTTSGERQSLAELLKIAKLESDLLIRVDHVNLMRSRLTPSGPIYTILNSFKLKHSC